MINDAVRKDHSCLFRWTFFVILVFFVKFLLLCIDPLPMFYLGDSHSYLSTAVNRWIPLDRSFVYGFVIRLIAVFSHSLTSLILFQVFTSGLNAIFVAYILQEFFSVRPRVAFCSALVCALEPLQLMYERYVLTEALTLFFLVLYFIVIFHYIRRPTFLLLTAVQLAGTALISFRLSFLSLVIINAFLLPLLAMTSYPDRERLPDGVNHARWRPGLMRLTALHLFFSLAVTYSFHLGYRYTNGALSHKPPAYQYQAGTFLLAYLGPIVRPDDLPLTGLRSQIFGNLKYDLQDRHQRDKNHWAPGGLIALINEAIPDVLEADQTAKETAFNAIKRDPLGLVRLGISGFLDYWNLDILKCNMLSDRGDRPLPPSMVELLSNKFSLAAEKLPFLDTLTNRYFLLAWPWYLFLLCSPVYGGIALVLCARGTRKYILAVLLPCLVITAQASVLIEGPTVRYLHALGWLSFLLITPVFDQLFSKVKMRGLGKKDHV
jgi:hypothetical protein